jgi:hypothetical protein
MNKDSNIFPVARVPVENVIGVIGGKFVCITKKWQNFLDHSFGTFWFFGADVYFYFIFSCVVDRHRFEANPDPNLDTTFLFDADQIRIWIRILPQVLQISENQNFFIDFFHGSASFHCSSAS